MLSMTKMLHKDIILLQRYIWIILIYAVIFSVFNNEQMMLGMLPGMLLILVVGNDIRSQNQQFLLSLPVSRAFLVRSKYISAVFCVILGLLVSYCMNLVVQGISQNTINWYPVLVLSTLQSILIFVAIYLPLYYWLGIKGTQYLNIGVMILFFAGSSAITGILADPDTTFMIDWISAHQMSMGLISTGILIILMIVSYQISLGIFMKRDL